MVTRYCQKEDGDIMAKTIFAGEEVKEFALKKASAKL
jgi:hypothetical protein